MGTLRNCIGVQQAQTCIFAGQLLVLSCLVIGSRKLVLQDTFDLPPFLGPTTNHHGKEGYEEGSRRGPSPKEGHESDEGKEGISD